MVSSAEAMFSCLLFWFLVRWHCVERGQDSCQLYLKAAFSEICLHGRGETVGATTCCQVRVPGARRAVVFQCKSDMPHGGRGFHPNCFFCGALLPPGRPVPPLRRVRRALIAIQPKGEGAAPGEKCFCRQKTQISRRLLTSVEAW